MRSESNIYFRYFTYIKPFIKIPIIRTYGYTIFTLLVMIIFIFFAIKPTVETILVLQKKLQNVDEVLDKINQKAKNLSLGKQNWDNLDTSVKNKIQTAIPDTADLKSLIQTLEGLAQRHEASISALQIQPLTIETKKESVVGNLSEISFTFNVEGIYKNLVSLLQDLKVTSRLISIDSVTINKLSEGAGLVLSISGKAYYLK